MNQIIPREGVSDSDIEHLMAVSTHLNEKYGLVVNIEKTASLWAQDPKAKYYHYHCMRGLDDVQLIMPPDFTGDITETYLPGDLYTAGFCLQYAGHTRKNIIPDFSRYDFKK